MFDIVFALFFLLAVTLPMAAVVFWRMRKKLRVEFAALAAAMAPVAFLLGFWGSMKLNYMLNPGFFFDEPLAMRMGMALASGIALSALLCWVIWRVSPKA